MGDEGGFAPNLKSNEEALEVILEAIGQAGYRRGKDIGLALDPAASEFYDSGKGKYVFKKSDKSEKSSEQMVEFWAKWVKQYPIVSLEDGMAEDDWKGWKLLTDTLGKKIQLVGDDLFVTNTERLSRGIREGVANSILIKVNQIGTLTETLEAMRDGRRMRATPPWFPIAPERRRIPSSPTWWWRLERDRSRRARRAAPIELQNTINCCASRRSWERRPNLQEERHLNNENRRERIRCTNSFW